MTDGATCTLERCVCPTCGVTELLLRSALAQVVPDFNPSRVTIWTNDFRGGAYPYIATVRVDDVEVYRIHQQPDEVFGREVMADLRTALRRPT